MTGINGQFTIQQGIPQNAGAKPVRLVHDDSEQGELQKPAAQIIQEQERKIAILSALGAYQHRLITNLSSPQSTANNEEKPTKIDFQA